MCLVRILESSKEYKQALEDTDKYKSPDNHEPITGFITYSGAGRSDKTYQHAFNFLISLNLQLIREVNRLTEQIIIEKQASQDIDKLTSALEKLNLGDKNLKSSKPPIYKFWEPRK